MKAKRNQTQRAVLAEPEPLKMKGAAIIQRWGLLIVTGLALLLAIVTFDPRIDLEPDSMDYIILGKAINAGQGMRYIHLPETPRPDKFPAGLPLLLSGVEWVAPDSFVAKKGLIAAFYVGSMAIFFRLASTYVSPLTAFLLTLLVAINPFTLAMASAIMSEIPYLFFSLAALWLLERALAGPGPGSRWEWIGGLAALLAAAQIRTIGWSLLLALGVVLLLRRRYRAVGLLLAVVGLLVGVSLLAGVGPMGTRYFEIWEERMAAPEVSGISGEASVLSRVVTSAITYGFFAIPTALFPVPLWPIDVTSYKHLLPILSKGSRGAWAVGIQALLTGMYLLVLIPGAWPSLRQPRISAYYMAAIMGTLFLWPSRVLWGRLLVPVIPLFFLFGAVCFHRLQTWIERGWPRRGKVIPALFLVLILAQLWGGASLDVASEKDSREWTEFSEMAKWIRTHTDPLDLILTERPAHLFVLTGRKAGFLLRTTDKAQKSPSTVEQLLQHIDQTGAKYLIYDGSGARLRELKLEALRRELFAHIRQSGGHWKMAYRGSTTAIFARMEPSMPTQDPEPEPRARSK